MFFRKANTAKIKYFRGNTHCFHHRHYDHHRGRPSAAANTELML